jgi:hypothetical protein
MIYTKKKIFRFSTDQTELLPDKHNKYDMANTNAAILTIMTFDQRSNCYLKRKFYRALPTAYDLLAMGSARPVSSILGPKGSLFGADQVFRDWSRFYRKIRSDYLHKICNFT